MIFVSDFEAYENSKDSDRRGRKCSPISSSCFSHTTCSKTLRNPRSAVSEREPSRQHALTNWLGFSLCRNVMVNGCTYRGSNSIIFIVAAHINWGHLRKERICSRRSKFVPLWTDPFLGRLRPPGKQTGSRQNTLPLKTWKKLEIYFGLLFWRTAY